MICNKCGKQMPDGDMFCNFCGAKLFEESSEPQRESEKRDCIESSNPKASGKTLEAEIAKLKKIIENKKILGIAAIAVVLVVAIITILSLVSNGGSSNAYVYLSDGQYELITNLSRNRVYDIISNNIRGTYTDSVMDRLLSFSPDGKYIYYYSKYNDNLKTGSLCRAEYEKLGTETTQNNKYTEVIATDVSLGFSFLADSSVIYKNSDNTLYYYNGIEPVQIARDVNSYFTNTDGRMVYMTDNGSKGYTLYGITLTDINSKVKLASGIESIQSADDFENILYTGYEDDDTLTLYTVGFTKEAEKLAEAVNILLCTDGKIYFTTTNDIKLRLYDFVEDVNVEADAKITEPSEEDFAIPVYGYYKLDSGCNPDDYDEIYTSCTVPASFVKSWFSYISLETAANGSSNNKDVYKAFVDKYISQEDENGYIVVTDSIKADLISLAETCGKGYDGEWLELCFYKKQKSTKTDYDAYYDARDKWREAENRKSIREMLQNQENDYSVQTMYCLDNGTLTTIRDNILNLQIFSGAIVYNTTDMIKETVKLEDISSAYDVRCLFDLNYESRNYVVLEDGNSCKMSAGAAREFAEAYAAGDVSLYFTNKEVYMFDSEGLSIAAISEGVIDDFLIVADDARYITIDKSTLYYAGESRKNGGITYGDVYSYNNGTVSCLVKDIVLNDINLYSDGSIFAYTSNRNELSMIDAEGKNTIIGDYVTQYTRIDETTMLYISDGDFYFYDGEDRKILASDVDWLWCQNAMASDVTLNLYDD